MAGLPSELWALILDYVPRPDLKSCRLLNRQVLHLASIFLFSKLCMNLNQDSFIRAAGVSESPVLSQYVKSLVYYIDGLQDETYPFRPERLDHFRRWLKPYDPDLAAEQENSASDDPRVNPETAQMIRKQGSEGYELQRTLARFPNLTGIELRCMNKPNSYFRNYRQQSSRYDLQPVTGRFLLVLLLLAKAPQNSVTSLVCEQLDWDIFERMSLMWIPVHPLLNQLRYLQLNFSMMDEYMILTSVDSPNALIKFLEATFQLEALLLDFGAYDNFDLADGAEGLGNAILTSAKWQRLKTLSLAGFIFGENELLEFLQDHPTLRNLRISHICLHAGTVTSMVLGLEKYTRLDNLFFHGVYDDRIFEDEHSVWEGSCITFGNLKDEPSHPQLPSIACLLGEEATASCAGYRSEEWFGGDGSWSTCDGTPIEEDLASVFGPQDAHCTANETRQLPSISYMLN